MKRRDFLKSTAALAAFSVTPFMDAAEHEAQPGREYYELKLYHMRKGPQQKLFDDYFKDAALPALKRLGVGPVGVFNVMVGSDNPTVYVLTAHQSLESLFAVSERLYGDAEYQKRGAAFLNAKAADPAFMSVESSVFRSIQGIPKLEVPAAAAGNKARIFELRIYESPSEKTAKTKIEMFNKGELDIFRRVGLQPVFFGEALAGGRLPNLTYLVTFESLAAREKNWSAFIGDPEWKKMSTTPGYTDPEILTVISNVLLRPAAYSEI